MGRYPAALGLGISNTVSMVAGDEAVSLSLHSLTVLNVFAPNASELSFAPLGGMLCIGGLSHALRKRNDAGNTR